MTAGVIDGGCRSDFETPTRCDRDLLPHRRSPPGRLLSGHGPAAL